MSRLPRFFVPGLSLHVIQRGNDRMTVFRSDADATAYRECLRIAARRHGVTVHAYVLMSNHVHLLVTPATAASLPKTMQAVGCAYVPYFNAAYRRTGTPWEGRYKAAIVDHDRYLLACMRYIELNPVRAGIVSDAAAYRWSSFRANARGAFDDLVRPHAVYWQLGAASHQRQTAYRSLFDGALRADEIEDIRDATQHGWAIGDATFRRNVTALGRRGERLPKGRRKPKQSGNATESATPEEGPTLIPLE